MTVKGLNHFLFSVSDLEKSNGIWLALNVDRPRDEKDKKSIYFSDPDGHKFEFHTGTGILAIQPFL